MHTKSPLSKKQTNKKTETKQNKKNHQNEKLPNKQKAAEILCYSSNSKGFLLKYL